MTYELNYNIETQTETMREYSSQEIAENEKNILEVIELRKIQAIQEAKKLEIAEKLGLTADDLKALGL